MKAKKTIQNTIYKLKKIADTDPDGVRMHEAWVAYHALRWVIETTDWNVESLLPTGPERG